MGIVSKIKVWLLENQSSSQTVAKNTVWLMVGQITSRILRAGLVIYAARILGAGSWGAFSYALAIATFLTTFSDFGLNALLTKEVARNPKEKSAYLGTTFVIKVVLLIILFAAALLLRNVITNIEETRALIPILVFVFAFDTLRDFGAALMRAFERMEVEAFLTISTNLAIVVFGFVFVAMEGTASSLAYAYVVGSALGFAVMLFVLRTHFKNLITNFQKKLVRTILGSAWPFGLMTLLGILMLNIDIIIIGWLMNAEGVGLYSAGQKLIQLIYVAPALFASALFPGFARLADALEKNKQAFRRRLEKSVTITLLIAAPLALGGLVLGDQIIALFFGTAYQASEPVFQILSLTFLIVFPSIIMSNVLFALGEKKEFIRAVIIGVLSNITANLLLIPAFGLVGAAWATIISQIATNAFFWMKMQQTTPFHIASHMKKIILAAALMMLVVFFLKNTNTHVISNVIVGGVLYVGILLVLREKLLLKNKNFSSNQIQ